MACLILQESVKHKLDLFFDQLGNKDRLFELFYQYQPVYIVGGWIRDLLIDRDSKDLDLITYNSKKLAYDISSLYKSALVVLDEELEIYRVVVKYKEISIDIARIKNNDLEEDILARDFTINSVLIGLNNDYQVTDRLNGIEDIKNKRLIPCSDTSVLDDPLRIFRIFRFAATLDFSIDQGLVHSIKQYRSKLVDVARERIINELLIFITSGNTAHFIPSFLENNILSYTLGKSSEYKYSIEFYQFITKSIENHTPINGYNLDQFQFEDKNIQTPYHFLLLFVFFVLFYPDLKEEFLIEIPLNRKLLRVIKKSAQIYTKLKKINQIDLLKDSFISFLVTDHEIPIYILYLCCLETLFCSNDSGSIMIELFQYFYQDLYKNFIKPPLIDGKKLIDAGFQTGPSFCKMINSAQKEKIRGTIKTEQEALTYIKNAYS